jgi:hypothetical protein
MAIKYIVVKLFTIGLEVILCKHFKRLRDLSRLPLLYKSVLLQEFISGASYNSLKKSESHQAFIWIHL